MTFFVQRGFDVVAHLLPPEWFSSWFSRVHRRVPGFARRFHCGDRSPVAPHIAKKG
jgi:hypothetical protein